jgi:hypothetical protein
MNPVPAELRSTFVLGPRLNFWRSVDRDLFANDVIDKRPTASILHSRVVNPRNDIPTLLVCLFFHGYIIDKSKASP